jgi:hypothetical protein
MLKSARHVERMRYTRRASTLQLRKDTNNEQGNTNTRNALGVANKLKRNIIIPFLDKQVTPVHLLSILGKYGVLVAVNVVVDPEIQHYQYVYLSLSILIDNCLP